MNGIGRRQGRRWEINALSPEPCHRNPGTRVIPECTVTVIPARARLARFADLLDADEDAAATERLRKGESVGRPIGSEDFLAMLEARTGRRLRPRPRGPKPRGAGEAEGV